MVVGSAKLSAFKVLVPFLPEDVADEARGIQTVLDAASAVSRECDALYKLAGPSQSTILITVHKDKQKHVTTTGRALSKFNALKSSLLDNKIDSEIAAKCSEHVSKAADKYYKVLSLGIDQASADVKTSMKAVDDVLLRPNIEKYINESAKCETIEDFTKLAGLSFGALKFDTFEKAICALAKAVELI